MIEKQIVLKDGRKKTKIPLYIYSKPEDLIKELIQVSDLSGIDKIQGWGDGGKQWKISPKKLVNFMKRNKIWGFTRREPQSLYIWMDKRIAFRDLLAFISHEVVHLIGPQHKRSDMEEKRACHYEIIGTMAFDVSTQLMDQLTNRKKYLVV